VIAVSGSPRLCSLSAISGKPRGPSGKGKPTPSAAAAIMAAQREKSAAVAVAPAHGAAVSGSPSPSSSSGGPAVSASSSGDRWCAAIGNLGELGANVDALQKLLGRKAVFVDDDIFSKASLAADQARTIKVYTYVRVIVCQQMN
jgi:hypothetical protein